MIKILATILFLSIGSMYFAIDESQEPPVEYTLTINGQKHELALNKSIKLKGDYSNPTIKLSASSIRHFTYGDIAFNYPASFTWEAKIDDKIERSWTLAGSNFTIMYFILPRVMSDDDFAQIMGKQFGKGSTRISDTNRELGGQKYKGKLLFVTLASVTLSFEVYSIPTKSGTRLLAFQDTPSDNRTISIEGERALALLSSSFLDTINMKSGPR